MITLEDVVGELLGGVSDEFKPAQLRAIRLSDGRLRVPAMMRLDQAALLIGHEWKGGAETLGDYIVERLRRVPETGDEVVLDGVPLEVEVVEEGVVMTVIAGTKQVPAEERR